MAEFYHFMNMRSPIDPPAQAMLLALGDGYRLSLPVEADAAPGIVPATQDQMLKNGIVGVYVTLEAASHERMAPHTPMIGMPLCEWLERRVRL
jgi:hypothetical protein